MSDNKAEKNTLSSLCNDEIQSIEQNIIQSRIETENLLGNFKELIDQSLIAIDDWDQTFKELNQELIDDYDIAPESLSNTIKNQEEKDKEVIKEPLTLNKNTEVSDISDPLQYTENTPINEYYANYMDANITEDRVFGPKQHYSTKDYLKDLVLDKDIDIFKKTIMITLHEKTISDYVSLFDETYIDDKEKQTILQESLIFLERYNALHCLNWLKNVLNIKDIKHIYAFLQEEEEERIRKENKVKEEKQIKKDKQHGKMFLERLEKNLDQLTFNKFQYKLFHESAYISEDTGPPQTYSEESNTKGTFNMKPGKPEHMDPQLYDLFFKPFISNAKPTNTHDTGGNQLQNKNQLNLHQDVNKSTQPYMDKRQLPRPVTKFKNLNFPIFKFGMKNN